MEVRLSDTIPIVLFAYKRLDHLSKCINSLKGCYGYYKFPLIVFCDGPRPGDEINVNNVINYLHSVSGFKSLKIIKREFNYGLSKSILYGLDEVFIDYDRAIIIEDDLILHEQFLNFMELALSKYQNSNRICSISGYGVGKISPTLYFMRGADCWGWGTWRRSWLDFERDSDVLIKIINKDKEIKKEFINRSSGVFYGMLLDQAQGRIDSWAIRWLASNFLNGKLTLYPPKSLVENIGCDGTGTHNSSSSSSIKGVTYNTLNQDFPLSEDENLEIIKKIQLHFKMMVIKHKLIKYSNLKTWKRYLWKIIARRY